jgi:hypothetical protein
MIRRTQPLRLGALSCTASAEHILKNFQISISGLLQCSLMVPLLFYSGSHSMSNGYALDNPALYEEEARRNPVSVKGILPSHSTLIQREL